MPRTITIAEQARRERSRTRRARHRLFARRYLESGGNASLAAREAGYSETSADSIGSRLLDAPLVVAELKRLRADPTSAVRHGIEAMCRRAVSGSLADFELLLRYTKRMAEPTPPVYRERQRPPTTEEIDALVERLRHKHDH